MHRSTFQQIEDIPIVFLLRTLRQSVRKKFRQKYGLLMQNRCLYKISSFNKKKQTQLKTKQLK